LTGEQRPFQAILFARIAVVANTPVIRGIQLETAFQPIFRPLTGEVQGGKMGPMVVIRGNRLLVAVQN